MIIAKNRVPLIKSIEFFGNKRSGFFGTQSRTSNIGEQFLVLTSPFWINKRYVSTIVAGSDGIEMINYWVTDLGAYRQYFTKSFGEIK